MSSVLASEVRVGVIDFLIPMLRMWNIDSFVGQRG